MAHVIAFGCTRAEDIEALVIHLCEGEIADELARPVEHRRKDEPSPLRHPIGESRGKPGFRTWPGDFIFRIAGDFEDPDAVPHRKPA